MSKNSWLQMISMLQDMEDDNILQRGLITIVAQRFDMTYSTVYQLWEQAACMHATGMISHGNSIPGNNSGRLPIYPMEFVHEGVKNVPLRKR